MSDKGRNPDQRTIRLIQGLFLAGFGVFLLMPAMSTIVMLLGRIREYHSLLQYAGFGACIFLGLVGFLYVKMGIMLLTRHHHGILRWRMLFGLLTGLAVWFVLAFWASVLVCGILSFDHLHHFYWLNDAVPVLLAGGLAGYVARRHGLVWGGMIGIAHQLFVLYLIWGAAQPSGLPRPPRTPINEIIQAYGLFPSILVDTLIVLLIGMASGYLGQLLEQTLRLRKKK